MTPERVHQEPVGDRGPKIDFGPGHEAKVLLERCQSGRTDTLLTRPRHSSSHDTVRGIDSYLRRCPLRPFRGPEPSEFMDRFMDSRVIPFADSERPSSSSESPRTGLPGHLTWREGWDYPHLG